MVLRKTKNILLRVIDFFYPPFSRWIPKRTFHYMACGGSNVMIDILLYHFSSRYLFTTGVVMLARIPLSRHVAAQLLSMAVCTPLGFVLSKYIVFPDSNRRGRVQLFRYGLLVATCVVLNIVVLKFFVEWCHIQLPNGDTTPAKILTSIAVAVFSYFSQRHFTFSEAKKAPPAKEAGS